MPVDRWGRTWALAFFLAATALGVFEYHFRQTGFKPALVDDVGLWCRARSQLKANEPAAVALVGSSRMQLDISVDGLANGGTRYPVQLAVTGGLGLPVLEHLSNDPSFVGTVICEVFPGELSERAKMSFQRPAEYVRQYETRAAYGLLETNLRMMVQSSFVSRLPQLGLFSIVTALSSGKRPDPKETVDMHPDRCVVLHTADLPPDKLEMGMPLPPGATPYANSVEPVAVDRNIDRIEAMVKRIQRGEAGSSWFACPPAVGNMRHEIEAFPRADEWDLLVSRTSAQCIHFEDDPVLSKFKCPEGSHLDGPDVPVFTNRIVELIFSR